MTTNNYKTRNTFRQYSLHSSDNDKYTNTLW